ncbi:hypothetical protein ACOQFV_20170 [Nocardiopsis changdeensis]|uniref:hypothetical protein n=1 Tax=Nocardiopsis TaxID=2013 RepID=UPI0021024E4E|nr:MULTISPECIES: hypothetical protein [Nocardiopsis]
MNITRTRWRAPALAETVAAIAAEADRAWERTLAEWGAAPGTPAERDLAALVADAPDRFEWRVVDAALDLLACPDCGAPLGSGERGCGPCDLADGNRYAAREVDRPAVAPRNEHAVRVAWTVARHPHRYGPRAVCGMELSLPEVYAGRMPTTAQAQAYRRLIDGLTDAQVESVASLDELLRLAARR